MTTSRDILRAFALGLLAALLLAMESCERSHAAASTPRPASIGDRCPFHSAHEWTLFLRASANQPDWGPTCEDSTCDAEMYARVRDDIQAVLDDCHSVFDADPKIAACTARLRRFVPAWMRQHDDNSYGFRRSNREYLHAQEGPDAPPGMMEPPAAIVEAIPSRARVVEAARLNGYKYLTHDSGIDGTRTFVFVPDPQGRFDQWFLLNLKKDAPTVALNQPLSILVVQKKDAEGHVLPKVRLHFRDYTISHDNSGFRLALDESKNGKCYACHTNGVRQLIPRITPVLDARPVRGEPGFDEAGALPVPEGFALHRLQEFNRKLRSYGGPDWNGDIVPDDFGPPLGKAQGCVDCHDGVSRAALNMATSLTQLEKKMYYTLAMPPDNDLQHLLERNEMKDPELTDAEAARLEKSLRTQADLTKAFLASRMPTLRHWLLEVPCE